MTEYKSEVKTIYAPQERVYERLANLNNLSVIQQNLDNPELRDRLLSQAGDKVSPSQVDSIIEQLRNLRFDADSVSGTTMVGKLQQGVDGLATMLASLPY